MICIVQNKGEGLNCGRGQALRRPSLSSLCLCVKMATVCPEVRALKENEKGVVDSLESVDKEHLKCLCRDAVEMGVIPQDVTNSLESMDWENVSRPRVIRYLLMHTYRSIEENLRLYERWLELLRKYLSSTDVLQKVHHGMTVSATVNHPVGRFLGSHVSILTEILASCAGKWEEISIALRLPDNVRKDLHKKQTHSSNVACLNQLLTEWILGEYGEGPTQENLEKALRSKTVGLGAEALQLQDNLNQFGVFSDEQPPSRKKARHEPLPLEIIGQSCDTVVPEGKSTLLEVQAVTCLDADIYYQWYRDGHFLKDGRHSNIVCINNANSSSKGTYQCCVSIRDGSSIPVIESKPIALKVDISSMKKILVDRYNAEPDVPEDSWPPVSNNTYINLALIKQGNLDKAGEYARNTVQGNMDDVLTDKESIEYENTFTNLESTTRLLIEGRPGSGKTTLVHKYSQDWAKGNPKLHLDNIKLVFLVHLRGFFNDQNIKLCDIVKLYYTQKSMIETVLQEAEDSNGEGLCFILDGLDEYRPKSMKSTFIYQLIKKEALTNAVVIVASRPAASSQFRKTASKQVEVIGFLKEQIFEYIEKYPFSEPDKRKDLHEYLKQHPNVHHMCYLPIHAAMVCYLFDIMGSILPRTETEMYKEFTNLTLLRTLKRDDGVGQIESFESINDLPDQEKKLFLKICKLSFEKTVSSKQAMKRAEVKDFFGDVNCGRESLGLITVDCMAKKYGFENLYTFLHLTFQEYLAAYHLFKKDEKEQLKALKQHGKKKHMQVVWKFYCGLTLFKENDIKFVEIMKSSHVKEDSLFCVQCAFESQQSTACDYVVQSGECGTLSFKGHFLTPSDFTAIGYVMRNTAYLVEKLVLERSKLSHEGLNALLEEARENVLTVKTLCFHGKDCNMEQYQLLNSCLEKMTAIEILDLSNTKLGNKKVEHLTRNITLPNLHTLKLSSPEQIDKRHQEITGDMKLTSRLDTPSLRRLQFNSTKMEQIIFSDIEHFNAKRPLT